MFRFIAAAALLAAPALAQIEPFRANFRTQMVQTNSTHLFVRVGGQGPAVVLLHGFGDTGDMWAPLAVVLAKDHTVIVPDLRGMGLSAHPDSGYTTSGIVPNSGHWIMEENPQATIKIVTEFLAK
jgi:pimeloyl-ACP methyl ester carboxylesterase